MENNSVKNVSYLETVFKEIETRYSPNLTFGCAIDGSQMSDRAVKTAIGFYNHKRGDVLKIIHVSDSSKGYLKKHLQPTHLRHYYVALASSNRVDAQWICREKEEGKSTCECVTRIADKNSVDVIIVGSFGRKGEKLDMLGSVSDFSLRQSHSSICIVRSTGPAWVRGCKFLFTSDGSHAATVAFLFLITFYYKPGDVITVLKVTTCETDEDKRTMQDYQQFMDERKVKGSCMVREMSLGNSTVTETILDCIKEFGVDVIVLGVSGYGRKKLGSVSEEISKRASCTTLVIKDSKEVINDRYNTAGASTLAAEIGKPLE